MLLMDDSEDDRYSSQSRELLSTGYLSDSDDNVNDKFEIDTDLVKKDKIFQRKMKSFSQNTHFNSNYDVVEKVNSGSFAVVYKCFKKNTDEIYAVKFIRKTQIKNTDKDIIINEITINNKLSHVNIVQLYETYDSPQISYLVFEYIDGGELFDEIVSRETYSEMDAYKYIIQLFRALKHCHSKNIIHRDIKPENILLKKSRGNHTILKLADFGVSKDLSEMGPQIFPVAGSLGYMAPEVLKKKKNTSKVDIYSAGIILYILLCGYPPFPQVNDKKVMINATKNPNIVYQKNWDSFSPQCIDLVQKMTVSNYKHRFDVDDVLNHEWCKKPESIADIYNDRRNSLNFLKQFNIWRKFVAMLGALRVADNLLKRIESQELSNQTKTVDSLEQGTIDRTEEKLSDRKLMTEVRSLSNTSDNSKTNNDEGLERPVEPNMNLRLIVEKLESNRLADVKKFAEDLNWLECMVYVGPLRVTNSKAFIDASKTMMIKSKERTKTNGDHIINFDIVEIKDSMFSIMLTVSSGHRILYVIDEFGEIKTLIMYRK